MCPKIYTFHPKQTTHEKISLPRELMRYNYMMDSCINKSRVLPSKLV